MGNCDAEIDCEVDCVIDQILREDRLESLGLDPRPDSCEANCEEISEEPNKNSAVETSARFSIRILEALRSIQRQKTTSKWPSSTMNEVVQYIRRHYNYDGDLCSQVETALNQVTLQGFVQKNESARSERKVDNCFRFVLKMGMNRYHLIGPFACSVLNPFTRGSCNMNRPNCRARSSRGRRRRQGTSVANSTCLAPDFPDRFSMSRLSTVSDIEDPQPAAFQNRNNWDRSSQREPNHGHPLNGNQELSILPGIHAPDFNDPIRRPGADFGPNHLLGDHIFPENDEQMIPPRPHEPLRRNGGGGGRGRVIRDRGIHENGEEMNPPVQNEPIEGLGGCEARGQMVQNQNSDENMEEPQNPVADEVLQRLGGSVAREPLVPEHSSDENMYCPEPAMNLSRGRRGRQCPRRRRRGDSSSSRNSRDTVISGCPARRSRRKTSNCSSDADVTYDTDGDDSNGEKPWVRNCKNQESRISNRRGRRCSSCVYN